VAVFTRTGKRVGCFILYGVGSDRLGIKALCSYLEEQGYITYCSGMRMELTSIGLLKSGIYFEWLRGAEKEFDEFYKSCDNVVVIGFSVGALIGLILAEKYRLDALIIINTPVYLTNFRKLFEILCYQGEESGNVNLNRVIISTLYNLVSFNKLLNQVKRRLYRLRCPLLVIQGKKDDIVDWGSACYIYDRVFSHHKEIQFFPKSGHFICCDCESRLVFIRLYQFIEKVMEKKMSMEGYI